MDFIKSEMKNIVVFVAILAGLYLAYTFFFKDSSVPTASINPAGSGGSIGGDILPTLNKLKSIKIDQTVFDDPVFRSLVNFSVPLPKEEVGRSNPFSPVGAVNVDTSVPSVNVRALPR